jgi:hypothetical protein
VLLLRMEYAIEIRVAGVERGCEMGQKTNYSERQKNRLLGRAEAQAGQQLTIRLRWIPSINEA